MEHASDPAKLEHTEGILKAERESKKRLRDNVVDVDDDNEDDVGDDDKFDVVSVPSSSPILTSTRMKKKATK